MKVLVTIDDLALGGSIITAIELAASVRDQSDWDVVLCAGRGPSESVAHERGLRVIPTPYQARMVATKSIRALVQTCRDERPDLVHAWGPTPTFTAFVAAYLRMGIPILGSITEMQAPPLLPPRVPITFVTEDIRRQDHRPGAKNYVQDPPINVELDDPAVVDPSGFRREHGLDDATTHVVIVSRLSRLMKLESVLMTIDAVAALAVDHAVDLVIVGDGDGEDEVFAAADAVNSRLGRRVVITPGAMTDPRVAYAAADIVVGMGTSVVRGMAFGKPSIVVGENGFVEPFTPEFAKELVDAGFYGTMPSTRSGSLRDALGDLIENAARREELGVWGRELMLSRFDVRSTARALIERYEEVVRLPVRRDTPLLLRASACAAGKLFIETKHAAGNTVRRFAGRAPQEARPEGGKPEFAQK